MKALHNIRRSVAVTLAALGMSGGYRRSPGLVYCSSDRAERTVLGVAND